MLKPTLYFSLPHLHLAFYCSQRQTPTNVRANENGAIDAAFKAQSKETMARLKASGVRVDTEEEADARLSEALKSFNYESSTAKKGVKR